MAKYAILSDIHANADALEAVLEKCRAEHVEHYVSLGDIVGYNAEPHRCLEMVRSLPLEAKVRGNHDDYATKSPEEISRSGFNLNAQLAIAWTHDQLSEEERQWLRDQPLRDRMIKCNTTLVHSTLDSPENWGYIFDVHHAADNFSYQFTQLSFCGHSHVPVAFCKKPLVNAADRAVEEMTEWVSRNGVVAEDGDFDKAEAFTVELKVGSKYLFNIGSIGQPRNHDPRASFVIFDPEKRTVTRHVLPYDVAAAQAKVREAGLPERLAVRLALGS